MAVTPLDARTVAGGVTAARGWRAGVAACGIKALTSGASALPGEGRDDLTVFASDRLCDAGGVFTTNQVKSASVVIDQLHLKNNRVQALVVCSGNANACTGAQGFRDALQIAKLTADRLDLDPNQVLVGTTGVIGRHLPMDAVKHGIARACLQLSVDGGQAAARAIMTTDTVPKTNAIEFELDGVPVRVGGMCKGSGMIHPNMATMLAYVTTDAAVAPGWVAATVRRIADRSFNQLTVDGDSSTNDTFLVVANGAAGNPPVQVGTPRSDALENAILEVSRELARSIARDGEGATKLITVRVTGAPDDRQARLAARTVASSSLVKTAVHGADPNWGRIVCALGYSGSEVAIDRLKVSIAADIGLGEGRAEAWGCDLSADYVRINADYTT